MVSAYESVLLMTTTSVILTLVCPSDLPSVTLQTHYDRPVKSKLQLVYGMEYI